MIERYQLEKETLDALLMILKNFDTPEADLLRAYILGFLKSQGFKPEGSETN